MRSIIARRRLPQLDVLGGEGLDVPLAVYDTRPRGAGADVYSYVVAVLGLMLGSHILHTCA